MNGLCLSDLPMVCDQVTCLWCDKYLGFLINGLCLGDLHVIDFLGAS